MEWKCLYCGKIKNDFPYIAKRRKYCSARCQLNYEYKNNLRDKTKTISKAHEILRTKGHYKRDNNYLSNNHITEEGKKRLSEMRKCKNNPMYGKTPWNKMSPTKKWWEETKFVKLRKLCLKRDNYKCVKCGISNKETDLYCDHIIPYRFCKEHKLDNLQTLCGSCHSKKTAKDTKEILKNID